MDSVGPSLTPQECASAMPAVLLQSRSTAIAPKHMAVVPSRRLQHLVARSYHIGLLPEHVGFLQVRDLFLLGLQGRLLLFLFLGFSPLLLLFRASYFWSPWLSTPSSQPGGPSWPQVLSSSRSP
jgi:hypothetical protein